MAFASFLKARLGIRGVAAAGMVGGALLFSGTVALFADGGVTDNFERSSLGSNWQVNFGNVGIVNNSDLGLMAKSGMGLVTWRGSTFSADQYSEAVISANKAPNMLVQAFVRRRGSDGARYGFHYDDDSNDSTSYKNAWQFKYDGVPTASTRIIASNTSAPAPKAGDTIRIEARGANPVELRGYHNGTLILTAKDTAGNKIANGSPGLAYRLRVGTNTTYPTPVVESWRGGSLDGARRGVRPEAVLLEAPPAEPLGRTPRAARQAAPPEAVRRGARRAVRPEESPALAISMHPALRCPQGSASRGTRSPPPANSFSRRTATRTAPSPIPSESTTNLITSISKDTSMPTNGMPSP